jgi:hypothetical protein
MVQIEGAVNLMMVAFDESLVWESNDVSPEIMKVLPVNFMTVTSQLYDRSQTNVLPFTRNGKQKLFSNSIKFEKLVTSLRTAYATELSLDKDQSSYNDLLDSLRLSLPN